LVTGKEGPKKTLIPSPISALLLHSDSLSLALLDFTSVYRVAQKLAPFLYALTLPNINRF